MPDVGDKDKLIINERWVLNQGSDTYVLKTLMSLRLSRSKTRKAIKAGPSLTFGAGDHGLDATLDLDSDQIPRWIAFNLRDANGKMPDNPWTLVSTDVSGNTVTIGFNGVVSIVDFGGTGNDGRLEAIIHLDITSDHPTVTT